MSRERGMGIPGRVGVVDVGSNTVRLVVYDVPTRLPLPIFNEKAQCALGSGLAKSGRLLVLASSPVDDADVTERCGLSSPVPDGFVEGQRLPVELHQGKTRIDILRIK